MRKQILFSTGTTISRALSGLVLIFILSRFLSVEFFGVFTYSLVVAAFFVLVVDYGFDLQLSRDTALESKNISRCVTTAARLKFILVPVAPVALFFFVWTGVVPETDVSVILVLILAQTAFSFQKIFLVPYRSVQNYRFEFTFSIVSEASLLLFCLFAMIYHANVFNISVAFCASRVASAFLAAVLFHKHFRFKIVSIKFLNQMRNGFPFFVHLALASIYLSIDTLIMRNYVSTFDLGIYQAGIRAMIAACLLASISQNVILPHLARLLNDTVHFRREARKYLIYTNLLGGIIALLVWWFKTPLITMVFGSNFSPLEAVVPHFAAIIFLRYQGSYYGVFLTLQGEQGKRAVAVALTVLLVIVFDLWAIPRYGIQGAATVLLGAHIFLNSIYIFFRYNTSPKQPYQA